MADITVTAANVAQGTGAAVDHQFLAGETITAGQSVYRKASDGRWWKAQCDSAAEEVGNGTASVPRFGVSLHGALAGQPLSVQTSGPYTAGGTVVAGTPYVVSATAGGICPHADLVATNKVTFIGYGISTTQIQIAPIITGLTVA